MTEKADQSGPKGEREFAFIKELIFLIPILGSTFAIIFDVGFFSGIDINFFTLFSLNEHIAFALQAFPGALFVASLVSILISLEMKTPIEERLKALRSRVGWVMFTLVAILLAAIFAFFSDWKLAAGLVAGMVMAPLLKGIFLADPFLRIILGTLLMALLTFAVGFGLAVSMRTDGTLTTIERKTDGAIQGRIMRSGDRGVLFYDPAKKQVALLRWDEIKQISKTW